MHINIFGKTQSCGITEIHLWAGALEANRPSFESYLQLYYLFNTDTVAINLLFFFKMGKTARGPSFYLYSQIHKKRKGDL